MTSEEISLVLHQLLTAQESTLLALMEAMRPDEDEIDQRLWAATQSAIWAMEGAIKLLDGKPAQPWEAASLELKTQCATCGCPRHK